MEEPVTGRCARSRGHQPLPPLDRVDPARARRRGWKMRPIVLLGSRDWGLKLGLRLGIPNRKVLRRSNVAD